MNIIVDADACPVLDIIERKAIDNKIDLTYVFDTSHQIHSDYANIIIVDMGSDSADFKILSKANNESIIITQDYALASLCLSKKAVIIHPNGFEISNDNIDQLLDSRYLNQKARKAKIKTANPKKRTEDLNIKFEELLESIIEKGLNIYKKKQ
ncbi:MAG: DUF188 domain-containing protein [Erysipelotrichales bacterium]